ncbi:MAG: hydantoinase/carbamoylase family amidase [Acidimicrobiaceae bacterium]|nr:hydantoinase/carbamoylase family amidase [Acidimicrobiaceae bacterium]
MIDGEGTPLLTAGIDVRSLLERLRALAESAPAAKGPGVTRLAWSEADLRGRALLADIVGAAGVAATTDAVGNLIAEWPGSNPGLPPLVVGGHIDTVVEAGALDGAYGTVAAFEIVAALARAGDHLRHPVRAVSWVNEEGVVAPPFTGSLVAAGEGVDVLATGPDDVTLEERIRAAGGSPERIPEARWGPLAGYLELHVEPGPVLDNLDVAIGVVTGITGGRRGTISITGRADHAGTTPMHLRSDALLAALPLVKAIEELATDGPVDVATVGSLVVHPGVGNVVPGRVVMTYDIRSLDDAACDEAVGRLRSLVAGVAESNAITVSLSRSSASEAVHTDPVLREIVAEAAEGLGHATVELASGAGHDAQHLAAIAPTGMIFVPGPGGVGQALETTPPERLLAGAQTLFAALRLADSRLDP